MLSNETSYALSPCSNWSKVKVSFWIGFILSFILTDNSYISLILARNKKCPSSVIAHCPGRSIRFWMCNGLYVFHISSLRKKKP